MQNNSFSIYEALQKRNKTKRNGVQTKTKRNGEILKQLIMVTKRWITYTNNTQINNNNNCALYSTKVCTGTIGLVGDRILQGRILRPVKGQIKTSIVNR